MSDIDLYYLLGLGILVLAQFEEACIDYCDWDGS